MDRLALRSIVFTARRTIGLDLSEFPVLFSIESPELFSGRKAATVSLIEKISSVYTVDIALVCAETLEINNQERRTSDFITERRNFEW